MSLETYAEARPWAKSILREISAKRMPPFGADGPIGLWRDDPRLTQDEIGTIQQWVERGAPRGNYRTDIASPPEIAKESEAPDRIVVLPEVPVAGIGEDTYATVVAETTFEDELWVSGVDWLSDGHLHHASLHVVDMSFWPYDRFVVTEGQPVPHGDAVPLALFVPGNERVRFPKGYALRLPAGSRLAIVSHYAPTDVDAVEHTRIGLHFANGFVRPFPDQPMLHRSEVIDIAPYQSDYRSHGEVQAPEDLLVFAARVHMHLRGHSAKYTLRVPGEEPRVIADIPRYDFHWQRTYYYAEPFVLPKGATVEFERCWDNSDANPNNPDPSAHVVQGGRTSDEMGASHLFTIPVNDRRVPVRVTDGHRISFTDSD
jgi:hypothetical protein